MERDKEILALKERLAATEFEKNTAEIALASFIKEVTPFGGDTANDGKIRYYYSHYLLYIHINKF